MNPRGAKLGYLWCYLWCYLWWGVTNNSNCLLQFLGNHKNSTNIKDQFFLRDCSGKMKGDLN